MEVRWASKPMGERCGKRDKDGGVPDNQLRRYGKKRLWEARSVRSRPAISPEYWHDRVNVRIRDW